MTGALKGVDSLGCPKAADLKNDNNYNDNNK
jgi:hypothetical protein